MLESGTIIKPKMSARVKFDLENQLYLFKLDDDGYSQNIIDLKSNKTIARGDNVFEAKDFYIINVSNLNAELKEIINSHEIKSFSLTTTDGQIIQMDMPS